ncbi:MAG: PqqD family peptide modification chaperone [Myxococcales bacterium]|nr:PqqD family peptide modification chaperone [Myxococcales bacterium]
MRYRQHPDAASSVIAGEAAVVTPQDSRLHLLDPIATRVWALCEGEGMTRESLVYELMKEFEGDAAEIARDVENLLQELQALRVIAVVE